MILYSICNFVNNDITGKIIDLRYQRESAKKIIGK